MDNELISIIVPIYKVEEYIRKCIESIINQTYKNLEIILVDDGSPDESGKICDEYALKDSRIKVIHKENGGLSDARNVGIEMANGKYIGFVDSDDYISSNMYEILLANIKKTNSDISIASFLRVPNDNREKKHDEIIKIFNKYEAIEELIKADIIEDYAWNKLYSSELFKDIKYPKGKKMEDMGTTYLLFDKSNRIVCTNKIVYYYIQREDSIMGQHEPDVILDKLELSISRYIYLFKKYPQMEALHNNILSIILYSFQYIYIYNKEEMLISDIVINAENLIKGYIKVNGLIRTIVKLNNPLKIKLVTFYLNKKLFKFITKIIKIIKD